MLSHQWKQPNEDGSPAAPLPFRLTSLTDRIPISTDDELVVVACPDPQVWGLQCGPLWTSGGCSVDPQVWGLQCGPASCH